MKIFFIAGYTGDIGGALYKKLKSLNQKVIGISGRRKEEKIIDVISQNLNGKNLKQIYFVNAIGCGVYGDFLDLTKKDFLESFECNFYVPIWLIQIFAKQVLKYFPDKITKKIVININSQAALKPFWKGGAYNSMKSALNMVLKVFEKEYRQYGFKVKQFFPPVIKTKMLEKMPYLPREDKILKLDDFIDEVVKELF